ncbi:MAG: TIR domain-containing protein [Lachnospiraceae bacterium]|nr:TIR domain-containing protein [Lachnospiraceae bacterium]
MAVIKCKMCGGELKILPASSICECEYCGSKQTIPITDDEKRLKLYERANKLRFENEFDKAAGVYESIVSEYQSEAEAYWGLVLCKYGIEYVDDPKTGKKIPTCHRSSFDSVMDDNNFDLVMENSDSVSRAVYREEAKQIEELRKGIVEVSSKEEPYDIFICYKETEDDGQRTIDSVIAQDVYNELVDKGYRVFFSRITLEDKLGQEYEPYIFAALNSAKVMLAFGTTYDHYNAVWVKNEWSRFLQLIEAGQKKTLIPCFKDIDAYDMPKEFARLQAQDMGKVGAIQDLLRGIDKIFGREKRAVPVPERSEIAGDSDATTKRGYLMLEDGEWEKAIHYFDHALDMDPENAEGHLGLFLAKRKYSNLDSYLEAQLNRLAGVSKKSVPACEIEEDAIKKIVEENVVPNYLKRREIEGLFKYGLEYESIVDGLKKEKKIYEDKDWKKAERFATGEIGAIIRSTKERHLSEIDKMIESETQKDQDKADQIRWAYDLFIKETENKVRDLRFQAEVKREQDYASLCTRMENAGTEEEYRSIITGFEKIGEYKDGEGKIKECEKQIEQIKVREQKQIADRKEAQKKRITLGIVAVVMIIVIIAGIITAIPIVERKQKYNQAMKLLDSQDYESAYSLLSELGKNDEIESSKYERAVNLLGSQDYESAYKLLSEIEKYDEIKSSKYDRAVKLRNAGDYEAAYKLLEGLAYKDSDKILGEIKVKNNRILLSKAEIGDIVKLGSYEQDNDLSNGEEDIEWIVLDKKGSSLLLISRFGLIYKQYLNNSAELSDTTWITCDLRKWLNNDFYKETFLDGEKELIIAKVADSENEFTTMDGQDDSLDRVFLLNAEEAEKYFERVLSKSVFTFKCYVTERARLQTEVGHYASSWLLRTDEDMQTCAYVDDAGQVHNRGMYPKEANVVRPAIWVNIDSALINQ